MVGGVGTFRILHSGDQVCFSEGGNAFVYTAAAAEVREVGY